MDKNICRIKRIINIDWGNEIVYVYGMINGRPCFCFLREEREEMLIETLKNVRFHNRFDLWLISLIFDQGQR